MFTITGPYGVSSSLSFRACLWDFLSESSGSPFLAMSLQIAARALCEQYGTCLRSDSTRARFAVDAGDAIGRNTPTKKLEVKQLRIEYIDASHGQLT